TVETIRRGARVVGRLTTLESELWKYEREADEVASEALREFFVSTDDLNGWRKRILENVTNHPPADIAERWRAFANSTKSGTANDLRGLIAGFALWLKNWRDAQIGNVRASLLEIFGQFPFFAKVEASGFTEGQATDAAVFETMERGYEDLFVAIDKAIVEIATMDVHPLDLPKAVEETRNDLSDRLRPYLESAIRGHEAHEFWMTL